MARSLIFLTQIKSGTSPGLVRGPIPVICREFSLPFLFLLQELQGLHIPGNQRGPHPQTWLPLLLTWAIQRQVPLPGPAPKTLEPGSQLLAATPVDQKHHLQGSLGAWGCALWTRTLGVLLPEAHKLAYWPGIPFGHPRSWLLASPALCILTGHWEVSGSLHSLHFPAKGPASLLIPRRLTQLCDNSEIVHSVGRSGLIKKFVLTNCA